MMLRICFCFWVILFGHLPSLGGQSISETLIEGDYLLEVKAWEKADGLPNFHMTSMIQSQKGLLFFYSPNVGVYSFNGNQFKDLASIETEKLFFSGEKKEEAKLGEDINGNIWIASFKQERSVLNKIMISNAGATETQSLASYAGSIPDSISLFSEQLRFYQFNNTLYFISFDSPKIWRYNGHFQQIVNQNEICTNCYLFPTIKDKEFLQYDYGKQLLTLVDQSGSALLPSYAIPQGKNTKIRTPYLNNDFSILFYNRISGWEKVVLNEASLFLESINIRGNTVGYTPYDKATPSHPFRLFSDPAEELKLKLQDEIIFEDLRQIFLRKLDLRLSFLVQESSPGSFWLSSSSHLIHLSIKKKRFEVVDLPVKIPSVRSIYPFDQNRLQVSTYSGNFLLSSDGEEIENVNILRNSLVIRATKKVGQKFWYGTESGLLNGQWPDKNKFSVETLFSTNLVISDLFPQKDGKVLIGTSGGVFEFNPATEKKMLLALAGHMVHTFNQSSNQHLWIGNNKGLFNLTTQKTYFPKHQVYHIYEETPGHFWLATDQGLIEWAFESEDYQTYSIKHGFSENKLHCVYPDQQGNLWMSTNNGLIQFNKKRQQSKVFFRKDGLPGNEFNQFAHYQDPQGILYLGGTRGLVKFDPNRILGESDSLRYPLYLRTLQVFDKQNQLCFQTKLENYSTDKTIRLPSNSYRAELVFDLPYYEFEKIKKEWRILPKNSNWMTIVDDKVNLLLPEYSPQELEIKAYKEGLEHQSKRVSIKFKKTKPIYKTPVFLALLSLIVIGLISTLARQGERYEKKRLKKLVLQRTADLEKKNTIIQVQKEELEKINTYKSNFFKNITHDFRTPISIILGSSNKIIEEKKVSKAILDQIHRISRNAAQLNQLVEQVFELSKIDNKQLQINPSSIEWGRYCRSTFQSLQPLAEEKNITFRIDKLPSQLLYLELDLQKIEQITRNLLGNALKFTPDNGTVLFSSRVLENTVEFSISDSGPGIPAQEQSQVFDRYFQGRNTDNLNATGLGLGLAICKEYLQLMDGKIEVGASSLGGALFTVSFPKRLSTSTPKELVSKPTTLFQHTNSSIPEILFNHGKPTLLVVEDNPDLLSLYRDFLVEHYSLLLAKDGQKALELLDQSHLSVDLILSDVMMPRINGLELLETLKKDPKYTLVPFILISALTDNPYKLRALKIGVDAYISKPFSDKELLIRIENLLHYQNLRRAFQKTNALNPTKEISIASNSKPEDLLLSASANEWLRKLEKITLNLLADPSLKISKIATELDISERALRYKIKSFTGLSPSEYLMKSRMAKAFQLITQGKHLTIAEVCYKVGLKNTSNFAKNFKAEYGRSPSAYLKR